MRLTVDGPGGRLAVTRDGSGPPVLLLHGWLCDQADLAPLTAELTATHDVIRLDLRGHGASAASPGPFTLDDFAADAAAVIGELGLGPVLAVGHSMGGAVALILAGRYPALVSGVIMLDSPWAVTPPGPELVARVAPLADSETEYLARRDRLRTARAALLPGPLGPSAAWPVAAQSYASLMDWDGPAALRDCPRPVHAVFADAGWRAVAADLPRFPGLGVTHVTGTGHWVQVERPDAVAAAVRAHQPVLDTGKYASLRCAEQRSKTASLVFPPRPTDRSSLCLTTRSC